MIAQILATSLVFCLVFFSDNVSGYMSLVSFEICEFTWTDIVRDWTGVYEYDFSDGRFYHESDPEPRLQLRRTGGGFYQFRHENDLPATNDDGDSCGNRRMLYEINRDTDDDVEFFQYLWQNRDTCSCENDIDNTPFTDFTDDTGELIPQNGNTRRCAGEVTSFKICGTWEEVYDADETAAEEGFSDEAGTSPADTWACRNVFCDELTAFAGLDYQGFEVFTDTDGCIEPYYNDADGHKRWECQTCADGYLMFTFMDDTAGDGRRCQSCTEVFGSSCDHCEREIGCNQCVDSVYDGSGSFDLIDGGSFCNFAYCGEICCEDDETNAPTEFGDTLSPTSAPTDCFNYIYHEDDLRRRRRLENDFGWYFDFCRWDNERAGASPDVYGVRYTIEEPVNQDGQNQCKNGVDGMNCLQYLSDNCADCNVIVNNGNGCNYCNCGCDDPNRDSEGCSDVADEYFKLSECHQCSACSDILNCERCADYKGCIDCEDGYGLAWDEEIGILYCEEIVDDGDDADIDLIDDWTLQCIEACPESRTRGSKGYCGCGCDCNECSNLNTENVDPFYCTDCHYHDGCDQCQNSNVDPKDDYFQLSKYHPCVQCHETFGGRCKFCNDFIGCAQCYEGFTAVADDCCGVVWCATDEEINALPETSC